MVAGSRYKGGVVKACKSRYAYAPLALSILLACADRGLRSCLRTHDRGLLDRRLQIVDSHLLAQIVEYSPDYS